MLRVQAEDRADHNERGRGAKPAVVHLALVRPLRFLGGAGLLLWARPVWCCPAITRVVGPAVMVWPGRYGLCSAGMARCASSRPGDARALSRGADDCERPRPSGT